MGTATRPSRGDGRRGRRVAGLILAILVPALLVAAGIAYFEFVDYVERDPRFCAQCHPAQPELLLWTRSQHRNIVCQSCHHENREGALAILQRFVFQGEGQQQTPHTSRLSIDSCEGCHLSHDTQWPQIGRSAGHLVHVNRAGESCLRCHAGSVHGLETPGELCRECHPDHSVAMDALGEDHCLSCHNFLTTRDDLAPPREKCIECHRQRKVQTPMFPEGAPHAKMLCAACHRPHSNASNVHVPCVECHDKAPAAGLHADLAHTECIRCHAPHTWDTRQTQCLDCHPDQVSHYRHKRCWSCHSFREVELVPLPGLPDPAEPPGIPE